jgi:carboxyl-terminal processing protease
MKRTVLLSIALKFRQKERLFTGGGIVPEIICSGGGNWQWKYNQCTGDRGNSVFERLDKNRNLLKGCLYFFVKMNATDLYFNSFQKYLYRK